MTGRRLWLLAPLIVAACGPGPGPGPGAGSTVPGVRVVGGPGRSAGRFVTPRGVSVADDRVFVVDRSGRLQTLDEDGRPRASRTLIEGVRGFPIGVLALGGGEALVCDTHRSQLLWIGEDRGGGDLAPRRVLGGFALPQRAARDASGTLYVTEFGDGEENRVRVLAPDGASRGEFGGYGLEPGRFTRPMGIAVVGEEVFVTDVSDRVVVYGTDRRFRREFGGSGDAPGELDYPYGICAVSETLYVCEYGNHRLQRFDLAGRSLGVFGTPGGGPGEFHGPWDVAADDEGRLWVCDTGNHRLVVVDPSQVEWRGADP